MEHEGFERHGDFRAAVIEGAVVADDNMLQSQKFLWVDRNAFRLEAIGESVEHHDTLDKVT